jgi:hypothetical protein
MIKLLKKIPFTKELIDSINTKFLNLEAKIDKLSKDIVSTQEAIQSLHNKEGEKPKTQHPGVIIFPPGHYYSPLPDIEAIKLEEAKIFHTYPDSLPGVDLNVERQLHLFNEFKKIYKEQPFHDDKQENLRFYFNNDAYPHGDGILLYCFIRYLKPKKIIDIGSGYSSCVILDTNELYFNNAINCTFIDPYPERLLAFIKERDRQKIEIIPKKLQEIDIDFFSQLSSDDLLVIDSTHVSKVNSDVNYLFFHILPLLKRGIYIHFHDIFYPFEYPKEWIYQGFAWNESYMLRAFLQYNTAFRIQFFSSYMFHFYRKEYVEEMPRCTEKIGGSIYIRKDF